MPSGRRVTVGGETVIVYRPVRHVSAANLDPGLHLGQATADQFNLISKLCIKEHNRSVRVIKNVEEFVGEIAIVDVHMRETTFETSGERFSIFRLVT